MPNQAVENTNNPNDAPPQALMNAKVMQKLDPRAKLLVFVRSTIFILGCSIIFIPAIVVTLGWIAVMLAIFLLIGVSYLYANFWYASYGYVLDEGVFRKEYGVIMRRNTNIPYERIQNVDIIRPLLSRLLGLSDLNIQTAGGSSYGGISEGRLPGLRKDEALRMQNELISRAKSNSNSQSSPQTNSSGL